MKKLAIAAIVISLCIGTTGCVSGDTPQKPTKSSSPVTPSPKPSEPVGEGPPPEPSTEPSEAPVMPIIEPDEPAHAAEITRSDAYTLCMTKLIEFAGAPDPRNSYNSFEDSYVEAVDGWWRVWIEGVQHPEGYPYKVALYCVINGYIDNPTFFNYGMASVDSMPRDRTFEEAFTYLG